MHEWLKEHKNEIAVGIVVFIITTFINRVVQLVVMTGPSAGRSLWVLLRDMVYCQASKQRPNTLILCLCSALLGISVVYIIILSVKGYKAINETVVINEINDILEDSQNEKDIKIIEEKIKKAEEIITRKTDKTKRIYNAKRDKRLVVVMLITCLLFFLYLFIYEIIPASMWSEFELSVSRVAPYIEENDLKMLNSKWVCMRTHDDYIEIEDFLEEAEKKMDSISGKS